MEERGILMARQTRSKWIKWTALLMICALLLSSCGKGTGETSSKKKKKDKEEEPAATTTEYVDQMEDYWDEEDEQVDQMPEAALGDSEAISFSPCAGVHINAKENQLFPDTEISFEQVTDLDDPLLAQADEELQKQYTYIVGAWKVDAGLEPDESLPGKFNVSIDLDYLEIEPENYEKVRAYRIADDGTRQMYSSKVEGNTLHYSANQNSFVVVCLIAGAVTTTVLEGIGRNLYFISSFEEVFWVECDTKYADYLVEYLIKDADPDNYTRIQRMNQIKSEQQSEVKALVEKNYPNREDTWKNNTIAQMVEIRLEKHQEYLKLRDEFVSTTDVPPEPIEYVCNAIEKAYRFMGEQGIRMPLYTVQYKLITGGGVQGAAVARNLSPTYVEFRMEGATVPGSAERENLLLTLTHESFHICQNRYRTFFVDSNRFDEMAALILEEEAYEHFKTTGDITHDISEFDQTPRKLWETLQVPIDQEADSSVKKWREIMQDEGYTLADFVDYLKKVTGKQVTAKMLMDNRGYWSTPTTTGPLSGAFGITADKVGEYFHDFLVESRPLVRAKIIDVSMAEGYKKQKMLPVNHTVASHVDYFYEGDYSMVVRCFGQKKDTATPMLIVMDDKTALPHGTVDVRPVEDYVETATGCYVPALKESRMKENYPRGIMEIYGKVSGDPTAIKGGYTVYGMDSMEKPEASFDEETLILKVKFPEKGPAEKDEVIDGYLLTITSDYGVTTEKFFSPDQFDLEQEIRFEEFGSVDQLERDFKIYLTLAQFVYSTDNQKLYGEPSEPLEVEIRAKTYNSAVFTYQYGSEVYTLNISGGRFKGLKFSGDSSNGTNGCVWLMSQIVRGETISIAASTNSSAEYSLSIVGYNKDVSQSYPLLNLDGMASFSNLSIPPDVYYIEIWWWCTENRGIQFSFEVKDEYSITGIPELNIVH